MTLSNNLRKKSYTLKLLKSRHLVSRFYVLLIRNKNCSNDFISSPSINLGFCDFVSNLQVLPSNFVNFGPLSKHFSRTLWFCVYLTSTFYEFCGFCLFGKHFPRILLFFGQFCKHFPRILWFFVHLVSTSHEFCENGVTSFICYI